MIRKLIILAFLILALAVSGLAIAGAWRPGGIQYSIMGVGRVRSEVSGYVRLKALGGQLALFYQKPDPGAATFLEKKIDLRPVLLIHLHGNAGGYFTVVLEMHGILAVSVLVMFPVVSTIRGYRQRRKRRLSGHCVKCGYSLTGNVSGVCPECGSTAGASQKNENPSATAA